MGQATLYTAARMKQIEDASVIDGDVIDDNLVLTRRDGSQIIAGNVKGPQGKPGDKGDPGTRVDLSRMWNPNTTYVTDDVVGFGGRMWKAVQGSTGLAPAYHGIHWTSVTGGDYQDWVERDPYFSNTYVDGGWEIYWGSGTKSYALTSTAGEFETSPQALKITLAPASSQWVSSREENVTRGGEVVVITVRAKVLATSPGATIRGFLYQNDRDNFPGPFVAGASSVPAAEGSLALTTAWTTYQFTVTAAAGKPRSRANIIVESAGAPANVVIDYILVGRQRQFIDAVAKNYVDAAVAPLAAKTYVDAAVAAVPVYTPQPFLVYNPTAVGGFSVAGRISVEVQANGKKVSIMNVQITRSGTNYGVLPSTSWISLGAITPAAARFTSTLSHYFTAWGNFLEGALPVSVYYDHAAGTMSIKAIPGHATTLNVGHFVAFNLVVIEA